MTTVDNRHIVNSHSSVGAIQVTDNGSSIEGNDGKVVVDEEIDSCEGEDYDEKMFQVALVNSVMDTGGSGNGIDAALKKEPGEMSPRSKARYALRKRRRPGEEGTVADHIASNMSDLPNDPLNELQHIQDNSISSMSIPSMILPLPTATIKQEPLQQQPAPSHNIINIKQEPQTQRNIGVTARGQQSLGILSKPPSSSSTLLPSTSLTAPQQRTTQASGIHINNTSTSGKSQKVKKKAPRKRKVKPPKVTTKTKVPVRLSIPVPNPLLAIPSPPHQSLNHPSLSGRQAPIVSSSSSVPCPLSVPSPLDSAVAIEAKPSKKTTISYVPPFDPTKLTMLSQTTTTVELPIQGRTRVFSVDLDPSTFDFSDINSIAGGSSDNKASADSELPAFQSRDRAFSFEVFNFAGDDLLPNPVQSSSMLQAPSLGPVNVEVPTKRPRGDSIIFDPASFQDGGIHEKNALEKARQKDLLPIAPSQQVLPRHTTQRRALDPTSSEIRGNYSTVQSSTLLPLLLPPAPQITHASHSTPLVAGQNRAPQPTHTSIVAAGSQPRPARIARVAPSNRSVQLTTLPSSLNAGAASNAQNPPTFQMELLNQDGRIGIYLPEARRLRIARFHAKRKMRIWRKRIKYDCRKKLADSRPRIKGRFVKRSDMD